MVKNLGIFMHAVSIAHLEMSAVTMKAMEETEEKAKGDSTENHAGLTCAAASSGEQSGAMLAV